MKERATAVEAVRRTNLGEVLRLVHHEGPRSRSVLTAETGLNRSTVADLVTALAEGGLVVEQEPDATRRVGRPSPVVSASADVVAIGVNPESMRSRSGRSAWVATCGFAPASSCPRFRPWPMASRS
jgi:biotin operon repressor